jgi:hypothetical protein
MTTGMNLLYHLITEVEKQYAFGYTCAYTGYLMVEDKEYSALRLTHPYEIIS